MKSILPIIILCFFMPVLAADYMLTLDDAIDIALEKSYDMKVLRLNLMRAEQGLIAAKGRFKTNADMSFQLPNWEESVSSIPVQNSLPVFNTTGSVMYYGRMDLNQPLPTDGVIRLRGSTYHRDVSTYLAETSTDLMRKDVYTSLSLQFDQPLFTVNSLKLGLKQADLNYERTQRQSNQNELFIIYRVTYAFFQYYQGVRQFQIAQDNVAQQKELYDIASKKFNAGLIAETEALEMEVDLAESENLLVIAESDMERTRDTFLQEIGLNFSDNITVQTEIDVQEFDVNLDKAVELALENRSEIRENEIDIELAKLTIKEVDAQSTIEGNLWASYELVGVSDANLDYDSSPGTLWNSSLEDMDRRPNNRSVGFTLSVPIFDWGVNQAEVEQAKAVMRSRELDLQEQKKTIVREVRDAVRQLKEAENRLNVLEKRQSVAQRNFDITLERFNNGDITSTVLADNRDRLVSAKSAYLSAYVDYKLAIADLKRKTLYDFQTNTSLVK